MSQRLRLEGLAVMAALLVAAVGCDRKASRNSEAAIHPGAGESTNSDKQAQKQGEAKVADKKASPYSPFGVQLNDGSTFELISFKDVGLKTGSSSRKLLFEAVAQAIAYQLKVVDQFHLQPRVIYDKALADPNNHTYCEKNRLYVDIWHGTAPERWGYSLWSGCSEAQQFAWREIEDKRAISEDPSEAVEPLARGIVESLREAAKSDCYRRAC
ncbi:MAG: hypothetical protein ABEN55_13265 [Bradymonadaceae bacterium]